MSIYYLLIGDKQTNKQIGEYFEIAQGASIQEFNAVRTKGLNLLSTITEKSLQNWKYGEFRKTQKFFLKAK